jgi:hypothetical protein
MLQRTVQQIEHDAVVPSKVLDEERTQGPDQSNERAG